MANLTEQLSKYRDELTSGIERLDAVPQSVRPGSWNGFVEDHRALDRLVQVTLGSTGPTAVPTPVLQDVGTSFNRLLEEGLRSALRLANDTNRSIDSNKNSLDQMIVQHWPAKVAEFYQKLGAVAANQLVSSQGDALNRSQERINEALSATQAHAVKAGQILEELETMQKAAGEATRKIGVSEHAVHFQATADLHRKLGYAWLVATVLLAAVSVSVGVYFWSQTRAFLDAPPVDAQQFERLKLLLIHMTIIKVAVLSLCTTAVIWAGKTYRSNRHNQIVNRHRENALQTFRTFVSSADDQTKNAVLLQATQCIFAPQSSGFATHEMDGAPPQRILEVLTRTGGDVHRS